MLLGLLLGQGEVTWGPPVVFVLGRSGARGLHLSLLVLAGSGSRVTGGGMSLRRWGGIGGPRGRPATCRLPGWVG